MTEINLPKKEQEIPHNKPSVSTSFNTMNSADLNNIIQHANSMNDDLRSYQVALNKVNIGCNIVASVLSVLQKIAIISLSIWYFIKHVIDNDVSERIVIFITTKISDPVSLSIICATLVITLFILKKYK